MQVPVFYFRFILILLFSVSLTIDGSAQAKTALGIGPVINHYNRSFEGSGRKSTGTGFGGMLQVEIKLASIFSIVPSVSVELPYSLCPGIAARIYAGKLLFVQAGTFASPGGDDGVYIGYGANLGIGLAIPVNQYHTVDLSLRAETFSQNEPSNFNHTYFATGLRFLYVFGRSKTQ